MINILRKQDAVIVTFEDITAEEETLIKRIERVKQDEERRKNNGNPFAKFRCNQKRAEEMLENNEIDFDSFEIILDPDEELPFK